jgi:sugar phosphate isomerase/epimerase
MRRRTFLGTSIGAAAGAALPGAALSWAAEGTHKVSPIGVQLYTVRTEMEKDFAGTIAKVAEVGYKEVEFAGYFKHSPKEVRATLDKNGLKAPSCHVSYDIVENHLPETIEAAHAVGHEYIVCPWIEEKQREAPGGWQKAAELFNKAGEQCRKAGVQFAYHNHTFEFQPSKALGAELPYDLLLKETDPKNVKMEMDLCWIKVAGGDPVHYFNLYPGRFPMFHVKDMKKLPQGEAAKTADPGEEIANMTDVGSGVIDWKYIFSHAGKSGVKHYIVEHDKPANPLESIAASLKYLQNLRY